MSKIGSANIQLLRPEFATSNDLFGTSMDALIKAPTPFKEAMANNFAYMQQQKVGELTNMLQQQAPQDPSDPIAMQEYMQQATNMAQDKGFNQWGINAGGAINLANGLIDRNQKLETTQGTNQQTQLANLNAADKRTAAMIENTARSKGLTANQILELYTASGIGVDGDQTLRDKYQQAQTIASQRTASDISVVNNQFSLQQALASLEQNQAYQAASAEQKQNWFLEIVENTTGGSGGGLGKTQGQVGSSYSTTANNAPIASAKNYAHIVNKYAQESGVSPSLINAMIHTESTFNPNARSPVGAQGLMQLMPGTAKQMGTSNGFNPEENIRGGARYIAKQIKTFGDLDTALMAYNWGPDRTRKWVEAGRDPKKVPKETREYLDKVKGRMGAYGTGATLGVSPSDSSNMNVVPKTTVKASDYITESNKGATRNKPLATKLSNTVVPSLAKHGLTWNITSGGQAAKGSGGPRVGSTAHDHGNSGDGDIKDKATGRKLSFNNEEDRKRIVALIEDLAAQGITGIGGHTDYMGDGRLHIGFQNNARVWGGVKGKASRSNTYSWMTDAFNRGRGKSSGSTSGGTSVSSSGGTNDLDITSFINSLNPDTSSINTANNSKEIMSTLADIVSRSNQLVGSGPKVDFESAGLGFMGDSTGSIPDLLKSFNNQVDFVNKDMQTAANITDTSGNARLLDTFDATDLLKSNIGQSDSFQTKLAKAREEAASSGQGSVGLSSLIGTGARLTEGAALLESAGYTQEVMKGLTADVQTVILTTLNNYLDKNQTTVADNTIKLEKEKRGLINYDKGFPDNYWKASLKNLNDTIKEDSIKWLEEETTFDKIMKGASKVSTVGAIGLVSNKAVSANKRLSNLKTLHENMIKTTVDIAMNSKNEYGSTLAYADIPGITKRAKEIYIEQQGLDDKKGADDIMGYSTKIINPGMYKNSVKIALKEADQAKRKKWAKYTEKPVQIPFAEQVQMNLRKDTLNTFKSDPNK